MYALLEEVDLSKVFFVLIGGLGSDDVIVNRPEHSPVHSARLGSSVPSRFRRASRALRPRRPPRSEGGIRSGVPLISVPEMTRRARALQQKTAATPRLMSRVRGLVVVIRATEAIHVVVTGSDRGARFFFSLSRPSNANRKENSLQKCQTVFPRFSFEPREPNYICTKIACNFCFSPVTDAF